MTSVVTAPACLQCATDISVPAGTELGEIVACPECGQEHEVLETSPAVLLDLAPEVEEDWGE
jgi:alpha-aminoadipate carrier protein LysW